MIPAVPSSCATCWQAKKIELLIAANLAFVVTVSFQERKGSIIRMKNKIVLRLSRLQIVLVT